jgi:O-methyltransferase
MTRIDAAGGGSRAAGIPASRVGGRAIVSRLNLPKSIGRAVAVRCLGALGRVPLVADRFPSAQVRRLIATAASPDLSYEGIYPQAVYAPWRSDREFLRVFRQIESHTLVDQYRCFELWMLLAQVGNAARGDILEVGVWRGGTGCLLAARSALDGARSTVYLCDTFQGVVNAGQNDPAYVGGEHADTDKDTVLRLAERLDLHNVRVLQGIFPDETAAGIADRTFRFCHIDVDVYESARNVFEWVWPRLIPGGIVVFDDYGFYSCAGVTRLVNEIQARGQGLVVYNLNGHALVFKSQGAGA